MKKRLGILGGMGPMATVEFYKRITERTPSSSDQDHLDIMILSHASLPDRTEVIKSGDDSELLETVGDDLKIFESYGCDYIAIPCNTFHYFHKEVQSRTDIVVLNMIRAAVGAVERLCGKEATVALLGTDGTAEAGVYEKEFENTSHKYQHLTDEQQSVVMSAIRSVKSSGNQVHPELDKLIDHLFEERHVDTIILACTELSIIEYNTLNIKRCIDAMDELVGLVIQSCV